MANRDSRIDNQIQSKNLFIVLGSGNLLFSMVTMSLKDSFSWRPYIESLKDI